MAGSHPGETPCTKNLFFGMAPPVTATNSVTSDPLFVESQRSGDGFASACAFRLRQRSPAIDAGVAIPLGVSVPASLDFFGVPVHDPPTIGFAEPVRVLGRAVGPYYSVSSGVQLAEEACRHR